MNRIQFLARSPLVWAGLGLLVVGCSGGAESVDNRSEALTIEQQNVLGFEQPNLWSSAAGPIATLSNDHTQGQKSLQVTPKGYVPYTSIALSSLGPVGSTLLYDLKLPTAQANRFWFGASQVFISIPSRGVYNSYAGQVELTGLPLDTWTTLSFALSPAITQTLGTTTYTDLKITIVLNVPSNATGTYLLDNVRFSAATGGGTGGAVGTGGQGTGGRGTGGAVGTGGQGTGGRGTGGVVGTGGQGTGGQGTGGRGTGGAVGTGGQGTGGRGTGGVVGTGGQGTGGQGTGGRGTGGAVGTGGQGTGGRGTGGVVGTGGRGTGGVVGTGGQGTGGRGTGGIVGTGGQGTGGQGTGGRGTGGAVGTGGQGTGGQGTGGQGTGGQGTGGQGTGGQGGSVCTQPPTSCVPQSCLDCTALNCSPSTDGCDAIADPAERQLCENLYACAAAPTHPGAAIQGPCTSFGDPTACWCGTNPTTCLSTPTGPGAANGPCLQEVFAAAHTQDPGTIKLRFIDPSFALGRAFNLVSCRGAFCGTSPGTGNGECPIP